MAEIYNACGLVCPSCTGTSWKNSATILTCASCAAEYEICEGVLLMERPTDEAGEFYSAIGGTHFLTASFQDNPTAYCTTRTYRKFLDSQFPQATGNLLDLGCGDGRLSVWAAERGFWPVVALDSNLDGLKRLVREARTRNLDGLVAICANASRPPLKTDFFDAVLCFEVLYYLAGTTGRIEPLRLAAGLLNPQGMLVLSEFNRYGRALLDVAAMDLNNARGLLNNGTRFEKTGNNRIEVFQWTTEQLREYCRSVGLNIVAEGGVSLIPALFHFSWTFTSYPLRPPLGDEAKALIEALSDNTSGSSGLTRNVIFAMRKD